MAAARRDDPPERDSVVVGDEPTELDDDESATPDTDSSDTEPSDTEPPDTASSDTEPSDDAQPQNQSPDRELTVIEMMDGPGRPTERTRSTVLWIALAFASVMMALTLGVIYLSGLGVLEIGVMAMLAAVIYGLIGALRYRGTDPMAQFEPSPIPKRRRRGRDK